MPRPANSQRTALRLISGWLERDLPEARFEVSFIGCVDVHVFGRANFDTWMEALQANEWPEPSRPGRADATVQIDGVSIYLRAALTS